MSHLLDDDDDLIPRRERELTLSTGSILGIFFGLVLLCGLFFAFGYNMGSKSHQSQLAAGTTEAAPDSSTFTNFKPSAGLPAGSAASTPTPAVNSAPVVTPPPASRPAPEPAAEPEASPAPAPTSSRPLTLNRPAPAPAPVNAEPMPQTTANGTFVVQIAAVSHQEDAELLVGSLRKKGYSVSARSEPQDRLIHIQVGPFGDKKTAEAMRSRLSSDGYNAIVK